MESKSAFGRSELWGHSPAVDVLAALKTINKKTESCPMVNVLSIGSGDGRHVLTSLCQGNQHQNQFLTYHVWEDSMIGIARVVLLVAIALDFDTIIEERVHFLLEIYGNTLLRSKTLKYLQHIATSLVKFITETNDPNDSIMLELSKVFDISQLKYKNRDELEAIFKFWMKYDTKNNDKIDMVGKRDTRLRQFYKDRYDFRKNLVDWDYVWHVLGMASIIHKVHFTEWRLSGLAFQIRDSTYDQPNITLLTYTKGAKKWDASNTADPCLIQGFWSDIENSPYFGFGIKSKNKKLFEIRSQQHVKTAVDVAEYNIKSLLLELQFGSPVKHGDASKISNAPNDDKKNDDAIQNANSSIGVTDANASNSNESAEIQEMKSKDETGIQTNAIPSKKRGQYWMKIVLMPLELGKLLSKNKYRNKFDCILVGTFYIHCVNSLVRSTLKMSGKSVDNSDKNISADKENVHSESAKSDSESKSYIVVESPKYMVRLRLEDKKTLIEKSKKRLSTLNMKCVMEPNPSKLLMDPPKGGLSRDTYQIDNEDVLDAYMAFST